MGFLLIVGIYTAANCIAGLGLNLQFGMGGIVNLAYILFYAAGAYFTAMFALGVPSSSYNHLLAQTYFFGVRLPWPLPVVIGVIAASVLGLLVARLLFRGMRDDFAGLVAVAVALVAYYVVGDFPKLFNGWDGLTGIPQLYQPLSQGGFQSTSRNIVYLAVSVVVLALAFWYAERVLKSPFGRAVRAVRENRSAAAALGIDARRVTRKVFVVGCMLAGLAGGMFVEGASVWNPSAWTFPETVSLFAALILGGRGNNRGAILGVIVFDGIIGEMFHYLPSIGTNGNLSAAVQWIVIGSVTLAFLYWRPQGLLPERSPRWDWVDRAEDGADPSGGLALAGAPGDASTRDREAV